MMGVMGGATDGATMGRRQRDSVAGGRAAVRTLQMDCDQTRRCRNFNSVPRTGVFYTCERNGELEQSMPLYCVICNMYLWGASGVGLKQDHTGGGCFTT